MDFKQIVLIALQVSIIATVFGFGLNATVERLSALLRQPWLIVRSLIAVFVIMPVVALALVQWFDFSKAVNVVLFSLALSPVPPLLPQREGKSGGNVQIGIALMAFLGLTSIVAVPAIIAVLERVVAREITTPMSTIVGMVLKIVIAPLAAGMILRAVAPAVATRLEKIAAILSRVLLPIAALVLIAGTASAIWQATGVGSLVGLSLFVVVGLVVGHVFGGPDPEHAVVLALSTACRHPAIALTIATSNAPNEPVAGTILLYLILNLVLAIPYVLWQKARFARMQPAGVAR